VKIFVTGAGQWRDLPQWPPATREYNLYPSAAGSLDEDPAPDDARGTFTFDPARPTPTVGGRLLMGGGYTYDSALALREDVLCFTGPVLTSPLEVFGSPFVELAHTTDNPHADLFVRLSEVGPEGRSRNVSDGYLRLDTSTANGLIRVELDAIAHRFSAGKRIRLVIAGGCHPRWERNLGTGEDPAFSSRMAPSRRTIALSASRLVLAVDKPDDRVD
jgi:putative CocE/NonD family hydrolase